MKIDPNIRPPAERFGGEGHAGDDPFAGERAGHRDIPPDPTVEVPDADVEDLIQQPNTGPNDRGDQPNRGDAERRTGTERT